MLKVVYCGSVCIFELSVNLLSFHIASFTVQIMRVGIKWQYLQKYVYNQSEKRWSLRLLVSHLATISISPILGNVTNLTNFAFTSILKIVFVVNCNMYTQLHFHCLPSFYQTVNYLTTTHLLRTEGSINRLNKFVVNSKAALIYEYLVIHL